MTIPSIKLAALAAALAFALASPVMASPEAGAPQQTLERLGPKSDVSVLWVGHSLMEVKGETDWGTHSLMTMLGRLADSRGLNYRMGDHTLWGSPMSALWRGKPHAYDRDASSMVPKREEFERSASQYDSLVITEGIPVDRALQLEYSAYYLRRFYCTLKQANPAARVYLYQTWVHLQSDINKKTALHKYDWRAAMVAQRKDWEQLADEASRAKVRAPGGFFDRIGWSKTSDGGCPLDGPIFMVPAGQAFIALADYLADLGPDKAIKMPDGEPLSVAQLYSNPYVDWPADWPVGNDSKTVDPDAMVAKLKLRMPAQQHDDIHASQVGVYFVALVHFATLYRQSPLGLPAPSVVGDDVAHVLQCIAWRTVVNEPRSGVQGTADCKL